MFGEVCVIDIFYIGEFYYFEGCCIECVCWGVEVGCLYVEYDIGLKYCDFLVGKECQVS